MEGTTLHAILAPGKKVEAARMKQAAAKAPAPSAQPPAAAQSSAPSQS